MSLPDDRLLHFTLRVRGNHPQLLAGLEDWLQRGLISESQVQQWCEINLSSRLPNRQPVALPAQGEGAIGSDTVPSVRQYDPEDDFLPEPLPGSRPEWGTEYVNPPISSPVPRPAKGISRLIQGLAEEISLRWLLFLGVFLVIVSSGVLAASQWNRFSPWAQYLVLLAYTLAFFGVSQVCQKRSPLRLTTQTLQCVSLLLVPVNFWAMDGLSLWHSGMGWLTLLFSVPLLFGVTQRLTHASPPKAFSTTYRPVEPGEQTQSFWGFAVLSVLQWGWGVPGWPFIAVYGGVFATPLSHWLPSQLAARRNPPSRNTSSESTADPTATNSLPQNTTAILAPEDPPEATLYPLQGLGHWTIWYGLAILVLRAIFVAGVDLPQLGLAIALAGWFVTRPRPTVPLPRLAELLGIALILAGWGVTLATLPLQTIAISIIALVFWGQRLQRQWRRQDWLTLVTIALQLGYQLWRIVPVAVQTAIVAWGTRITQAQDYPLSLLSLAGFFYVFGLIIAAQWFLVRRKDDLVRLTDGLTIGLTSILLTLSLVTRPLSTLCFGLATIASGLTLLRPSRSSQESAGHPFGVYLTHALALVTLLFGMAWLNPDWSLLGWARFTLGLALLHWSMGLLTPRRGSRFWHGQRSSLGWASLFSLGSYGLFLLPTLTQQISPYHSLLWGSIPLTLTGLEGWHRSKGGKYDRHLAVSLSVLSLCLLQGLTIGFLPTRQLGLLFALVNLLINSWLVPRTGLAALTLGFAFLSSTVALSTSVQEGEWLIYWAVVLNGLWGIDRVVLWFSRRSFQATVGRQGIAGTDLANSLPTPLPPSFKPFTQAYHRALQGWGRTIGIVLGAIFTLTALIAGWSFSSGATVPVVLLWAVGFFGIALLQRSYPWRTNSDLYTLAWGVELLLVHGLSYAHGRWATPYLNHALLWAHLGLGLGTQLLGYHLARQHSPHRSLTSLKVIPLLWAGLAGISRLGLFTPWTGVITLGMSWIALQVGRSAEPQEHATELTWQVWTPLGLGGLTLGLAELIAFPLRQDLQTLWLAWAGLGGGLALLYRYGAVPVLGRYLRLSGRHLRQIAHFHWGSSSSLLMLVWLKALYSPTPTIAAVIPFSVGILLLGYALAQARYNSQQEAAVMWTYGGYLHLSGLCLYAWTIAPEVWQQGFREWGLAIVTPLCLVFYLAPWQRWGWVAAPWQQVGIGLPLLLAIVTVGTATSGSWFIVAIGYGVLSYRTQQGRLSYLALLFLDATIWRWCIENDRSGWLWYSIPLALSLLWVTTIDPQLQEPDNRETRHNLRLLATTLICAVPLLPDQGNPLLIVGLSLLSIFAGLLLRVRAFLYIGTATFLGYSFYQLIILVTQQSLLKWAIGLGLGIVMIWIAATFETRRDQIRSLLYNWADALADWD
ncbi:MAG: hypothetical protein ACO3EZ_04110 [Prochlorotrichaceae cyanobacterium]